MRIKDFLAPERIELELESGSKKEALIELSRLLRGPGPDRFQREILRALEEREAQGSTGIGEGVAIPHAKLPGLSEIRLAFARSPRGIEFESSDGGAVFLLVALIAPEGSVNQHLNLLARLSRVLKDPLTRRKLQVARDPAEVLRLLCEEEGE